MRTDPILTSATDEQLGLAVFENLYDLFRAMAWTLPDSQIVENEKFSRHLTFPGNPMFKGVWRTRLNSNETDKAIQDTISWFKERNAPFFFWWTGGDSSPADLDERLARHGMISMEEQTQELAKGILSTESGSPCMVAELSNMNEDVLKNIPNGFNIEEITTEASLYEFKKVFVETYEIPDWAGQAWVDATLKVGIGKTSWKMYIGRLDGNPVATNMLYTAAGLQAFMRWRLFLLRVERELEGPLH